MTDRKANMPKWIMIYGGLLVIVGLGSGMIGLLAPSEFFNDFPNFSEWAEISFVTNAWGIRNIAMAIAMIIALWLRTPTVIAAVFSMRFLTELGDLLNSIITGHGIMGSSLIVFIIVWILLCSVPEFLAARWGFKTAAKRKAREGAEG